MLCPKKPSRVVGLLLRKNKAQNDSWFSCHVLLSWIREKMEELLQQWEMPTSFRRSQHYAASARRHAMPATNTLLSHSILNLE